VKGCSKLEKVDFEEFSLVSLPINVVLRLRQGVFKNWCIDITLCSGNQHRPFVDHPIDDVISTINFHVINPKTFGLSVDAMMKLM
jgi:hypothetical protein